MIPHIKWQDANQIKWLNQMPPKGTKHHGWNNAYIKLPELIISAIREVDCGWPFQFNLNQGRKKVYRYGEYVIAGTVKILMG